MQLTFKNCLSHSIESSLKSAIQTPCTFRSVCVFGLVIRLQNEFETNQTLLSWYYVVIRIKMSEGLFDCLSYPCLSALSYNIALCHYSLKNYAQAIKYIQEIIERGIREHPGETISQ